MTTWWSGKRKEINDGAGLCSPGRWPPCRRAPPASPYTPLVSARLRALLRRSFPDMQKVVFSLCLGRYQCSPFSEAFVKEARACMAVSLIEQEEGLKKGPLMDLTPGQPFFLHLLAAAARLAGDPD